jgi:hypothetical protein
MFKAEFSLSKAANDGTPKSPPYWEELVQIVLNGQDPQELNVRMLAHLEIERMANEAIQEADQEAGDNTSAAAGGRKDH